MQAETGKLHRQTKVQADGLKWPVSEVKEWLFKYSNGFWGNVAQPWGTKKQVEMASKQEKLGKVGMGTLQGC